MTNDDPLSDEQVLTEEFRAVRPGFQADGPGTDALFRAMHRDPRPLSDAAEHPAFPHQSTADQWFDESQTESYRMLGIFTVRELSDGWTGGTLDDWRAHLEGADRPRSE